MPKEITFMVGNKQKTIKKEGNYYFGMTSKNISEEFHLAKFQRGVFLQKIKAEVKAREAREANTEHRKEVYGDPKYRTFPELVNAYLNDQLTDKEYGEEYKKYWNVYDDRGSDKRMKWLIEQFNIYNEKYEYWYEKREKDRRERVMMGWSGIGRKVSWEKNGKPRYLRRKHKYYKRRWRKKQPKPVPTKLKPRSAKRSNKWLKEHEHELVLINSSSHYSKRPWLSFGKCDSNGSVTSDAKDTVTHKEES